MTQTRIDPRPPSEQLPRGVRDMYRVADAMQERDDSLIAATGLLLEQIADLHAHPPCPVCSANGGMGACPLAAYGDTVAYAYLLSLLDDR